LGTLYQQHEIIVGMILFIYFFA